MWLSTTYYEENQNAGVVCFEICGNLQKRLCGKIMWKSRVQYENCVENLIILLNYVGLSIVVWPVNVQLWHLIYYVGKNWKMMQKTRKIYVVCHNMLSDMWNFTMWLTTNKIFELGIVISGCCRKPHPLPLFCGMTQNSSVD